MESCCLTTIVIKLLTEEGFIIYCIQIQYSNSYNSKIHDKMILKSIRNLKKKKIQTFVQHFLFQNSQITLFSLISNITSEVCEVFRIILLEKQIKK